MLGWIAERETSTARGSRGACAVYIGRECCRLKVSMASRRTTSGAKVLTLVRLATFP